MELPVISQSKASAEAITVAETVFDRPFNAGLVHQAVVAYMAGGRAGTKAQKNRSDVRGGGRKPWRQKGTGRARAGTIRSPLWRSGGVTFAARPRDFSQKLNKKMFRVAWVSALSELQRQGRLLVLDKLVLEQPKTREFSAVLKTLELDRALVVLAESDRNIELAARNIPNIEVTTAMQLNIVQSVGAEKIVITAEALKKLEERLS